MITRNSAKCRNCGDEIESKFKWNFVVCSCYKISDEAVHKISQSEMYTKKGLLRKSYVKFIHSLHGIFVDGGKDYMRHGFYNVDDYENTSIEG